MGSAKYKLVDAENDDVYLAVCVEELRDSLPCYDDRRALIAKDSLASVDGFRVLVLLAYEHLFGMRVCWHCPHCNHGEGFEPCQDFFGSNATPEGGVFSRMDAGFSSFECQKSSGALHAHSQLFPQCIHQHLPLIEVLRHLADKPDIVEKYLSYKRHVSRQEFCDEETVQSWENGRRQDVENRWPDR